MGPDPGRLFSVPTPRRSRGRVRRGFDATLSALRGAGDLEERHQALVALARVMADQVDRATEDPEESRFTTARVAAAYHATLQDLLGQAVGSQTTALAALIAQLVDDPDEEPEDGEYPEEPSPEVVHPAV